MSSSQQTKCPFRVGDTVIYRPTQRGLDLDVMIPASQKPLPGAAYAVREILQDRYVVVDTVEPHPGGGIYWTEFTPKE